MKIIKIDKDNLVNGAGSRCVVWVSGCHWNCPNCHNKEAQNPEMGDDINESHWEIIKEQLNSNSIDGVTLTGGDPLFLSNREGITNLAKKIKEGYPDKTIWMWTGFSFENVKQLEVMKYIDVLVDGTFIQELKPKRKNLRYRGSYNQQVIDVQKSLEKGTIVLWEDFDGWNSSKDKK